MVVSITNDVGIIGFVLDTASHGPDSREAADQDRNPIKVSSKLADIKVQRREWENRYGELGFKVPWLRDGLHLIFITFIQRQIKENLKLDYE